MWLSTDISAWLSACCCCMLAVDAVSSSKRQAPPSCLPLQAMEPFFSVLLSAIFLGDAPTLPVVMTLFPIVGGVAMASISEATFNWPGFIAAMGSNVTFQSRNVFSKKFMGKGKVRLARILAAALSCRPGQHCESAWQGQT